MADDQDGGGERREQEVQTKTIAALVAALVLAALIVTFILQNSKRVPVHFLWMHRNMRLGLALLVSAVIGGALAVVLNAIRRRQNRRNR